MIYVLIVTGALLTACHICRLRVEIWFVIHLLGLVSVLADVAIYSNIV